MAFPSVTFDPEDVRDGARRVRRRGADVADRVQQPRRTIPHLEERILILGTGHAARMLAQQIGMRQDFGYRLVGFVDGLGRTSLVRRHDILGEAQDIGRLVAERDITRIVVSLSDRRGHLPIDELLRAKLSGVRVEEATTTYERLTGKILLDNLKPSWLIFSDGFRASRLTRVVKRTLDLVLSVIGFVLAMPLMVLAAVAIRVRLARAGAVLPGTGRRERTRVHALQVSLDACGCRERHARLGRANSDDSRHPRRPLPPRHAARRAASALERDARAT